jgi:hypothetical protein
MSKSRTYCTSCGEPHSYAGARPNFCGSCGAAFAGNTPRIIKKEDLEDEESEALNDDDEDYSPIDKPDKLDIDIEPYSRNRETFGQIAMTSPINVDNIQARPGEDLTPKQALKQFKDEAKTLRKNT